MLTAPWYSGLAQGQALSLMSDLYAVTGADRYLTAADGLSRSLVMGTEGVAGEVEGSWWISEYPLPRGPQLVFNGHMFGVIGLWDYWQLTARGGELFCAGVATMRDHVDDMRAPGDASWYDVQHSHQVRDLYHPIHVWQLKALAAMSGSEALQDAAEQLEEDYSPP